MLSCVVSSRVCLCLVFLCVRGRPPLWRGFVTSGLTAMSRKKNFPKSHIINLSLTRLVRSRWLGIGFVLFLLVYGP